MQNTTTDAEGVYELRVPAGAQYVYVMGPPTDRYELSEDLANKDHGGALGWMTRERLPADFAAAVFSLALNQPRLIRTTLGWHLVEVTARKAAGPRTFEQAKPEILAALEAVKRRQATADFRQTLRKSAASKIEISQDVLAE